MFVDTNLVGQVSFINQLTGDEAYLSQIIWGNFIHVNVLSVCFLYLFDKMLRDFMKLCKPANHIHLLTITSRGIKRYYKAGWIGQLVSLLPSVATCDRNINVQHVITPTRRAKVKPKP